MPIKILSDEIASQIAAGEVVERPASVVKELVENALDAGANFISIEIADAGKELIEVADDGQGIPANELPLSVARHATSKLASAQDLFLIASLGFRGEALASIGSVSRMTITSRSRGEHMGAELVVDGGAAQDIRPVGAPAGTVVRVENLFYNVPARFKFLKTDRTEQRRIVELVERYSLAYPAVRFNLKVNNRKSVQTTGNGDRREVLVNFFGAEHARQMIEVLAQYDEIEITGYISPPSVTRSNRKAILFFVNGRPVQDYALNAALVRAYHTLLMVGRFPMGVLFINIPPGEVDVNVHPAKSEVRFRQQDEVFRSVGRAVRSALMAHTPVQESTQFSDQLRWNKDPFSGRPAAPRQLDPAWEMSAGAPDVDSELRPDSPGEQAALPEVAVPLLRLIGQVAATYLIAEGPDGLYLIDQHAAHERVLYERFMAQQTGEIPAQQLLEPATVELPSASADLLEEHLPLLNSLGFQVEIFGGSNFLVRAIPQLLDGLDPAAALQVVVEDFEEDEAPLQDRIEARIIARVCKRAAVKAGQTLSPQEQESLLSDLEASQSPRTCPHGRPTMIHLSVDLLERQFGRKGAR
jgi:DNA mismatch repair protein MutL